MCWGRIAQCENKKEGWWSEGQIGLPNRHDDGSPQLIDRGGGGTSTVAPNIPNTRKKDGFCVVLAVVVAVVVAVI